MAETAKQTTAAASPSAKPAAKQPPVKVIQMGKSAPPDEEPSAGGPEPDFDTMVAEHAREQREVRRAAKRGEEIHLPKSETPPQEEQAQAEGEAEPEQQQEPEQEKPDEPETEGEPKTEPEKTEAEPADDVKTVDEAKEVLRLARDDPRAFAAKYAPALFARQFAALSKQEADVRQREQKVKADERVVTTAQALMRAFQSQDPAELLTKWAPPGFYDRLTRYMLNGHKVAPEDQIAAQRQEQEQTVRQVQELQYQIQAADWRGELRGVLLADKYKDLRAIDDVVRRIEDVASETLTQSGRLLQPSEAADMLLSELQPKEPDDSAIDTWLKSPTVRAKLEEKLGVKPAGAQGPSKTVTSPKDSKPGQQTLTENTAAKQASEKPLLRENDEESFMRFLASEER